MRRDELVALSEKVGEHDIDEQDLIAFAETAREKGMSVRLVDGLTPQRPGSVRVLVAAGEMDPGGFPQDFWLGQVKAGPNLSESVLAVIERRS